MADLAYIGVPQVSPDTRAPDDYQRSSGATADAFGGAIGKGLEQFGQGALTLGRFWGKVATDEELNNAQRDSHNLVEEFKKLRGADALRAQDDYTKRIDEVVKRGRENLTTPEQVLAYDNTMRPFRERYLAGQMTSHAVTQGYDHVSSVNKATITNSISMIPSASDQPEVVKNLIGDAVGASLKQIETQYGANADPALKIAAGRSAMALGYKTWIDTINVDRPAIAQEMTETYKTELGEHYHQVAASTRAAAGKVNGDIIADEETGRRRPGSGQQSPIEKVPPSFIDAVKQSEGFEPTAKPDGRQHSNGYGTKASAPGETISREEADKRFAVEFGKAAKFVDSINPDLDRGSRAALSSLTFNSGTAWASQGLGDAVRAGDVAAMREKFLQYDRADGGAVRGLALRRAREVSWFGSNEAPVSNAPTVDHATAFDRILARTNGNPWAQQAALARANQIYSVYHTEQVADKAAFVAGARDDLAQAWDGKPVAIPKTEADFVLKIGPDEGPVAFKRYQESLEDAGTAHSLGAMGPDQLREVFAKVEPQLGPGYEEGTKRRDRMVKIAQTLETERVKDPAAYAERYLPAVQAARQVLDTSLSDPKVPMVAKQAAARQYAEVMLSEQARVAGGVGMVDTRVLLSKPRIEELKASLTAPDAAGGPGPVSERIKQLGDLWGVDNYARIYRQFGKDAGGLLEVLGSGVNPDAARFLVAASPLSPQQILKDESKDKFSLIADEVRTAMAPFNRSLPGEGRDTTIHNFEGQMQKRAAHLYVTEGSGTTGSAAQSAAKAFKELIGDKYTFGPTYRVPKDIPEKPDEIALGAEWAKKHLADLGISPAYGDRALTAGTFAKAAAEVIASPATGPARAYDYLTRARATDMGRNGIWATAPHEEGLVLMDPRTERPVGRASAKPDEPQQPLIIPWAKLAEYSQQAVKDRAITPEHKTFKERNADLYWPQGERYQGGAEPALVEVPAGLTNPSDLVHSAGRKIIDVAKSLPGRMREHYEGL